MSTSHDIHSTPTPPGTHRPRRFVDLLHDEGLRAQNELAAGASVQRTSKGEIVGAVGVKGCRRHGGKGRSRGTPEGFRAATGTGRGRFGGEASWA